MNLWARWYQAADRRTKAKHDAYLDVLEHREAADWERPYAKHLGNGLFQIYVPAAVQWRLLGFFSPNHKVSIVLICNHKQNIYDPPDAIDKARLLQEAIQNGKKKEKQCDRPGKA